MKEFTTEQLRNELASRGWQTQHLWHMDDVLQNYKCSEAEAMDVIESAFKLAGVREYIFDTIDEICWQEGIKQKRS